MPQNSSKHSNKPRNTTKGSNSSTATAANETSSTWQRGQGAFSGKAKKDYLKWKRQQKAAAASTDDDSDWLPEASPGTATNPATQDSAAGCNSMHPTLTSPAAEPEAASAVAIGRTWAAHTADDPSAPLQYRPLVAVTAAPFDARLVQGSSAAAGLKPPQQPGHADAANTAASTAAISVSPCDATARSAKSSPAAELHPQQQPGQADEPQTESTATTAASCTAAAVDSCGVQAVEGIMYMPILDPAEVGFTAEGFELGMPTRPRWQVSVGCHSAMGVLLLETSLLQARLFTVSWWSGLLPQVVANSCRLLETSLSKQFPKGTPHCCASLYHGGVGSCNRVLGTYAD